MLRLNRFNLAPNPITTLSTLLTRLAQDAIKNIEISQQLAEKTSELNKQIETKRCITCQQIKPLDNFYDPDLKSNYGRKCTDCKTSDIKPKAPSQKEKSVLELEDS